MTGATHSRRARSLLRQLLAIAHLPVAWARSLWRSRILLEGHWSRYMGFRPKNALNSLYYRTQWLNIDRYGRHGRSPVLGLGDYPLSRWFHIANLSNYLYAHAGAVTMLAGTLMWVAGHLLWLETASTAWVLLVVATLFFSTTAYAMAFVRQNYNILGWLWLPVALFAALSGLWIVAVAALFAASLASITVVFVAVPLMAVYALAIGGFEPLWILVPALLKIALHLRPLFATGGFRAAFRASGKLIGLVPTAVRYRRESMRFRKFSAYCAVLYVAACGALWLWQGAVPVLPLAAAALFIVNQVFLRFADDQSVVILFVTVFAAQTLSAAPGVVEWLLLFAVANPLPALFGIAADRGGITVFAPFDHSSVEQSCERLLSSVPAGSRVLFAFDDPNGRYEQLFDGYRITLEPLQFVAVRRGIHLFPDWYAVAETNHPDGAEVWGRTLPEVRANLQRWDAGYVLRYGDVTDDWHAHFEVVATFDWAIHREEFGDAPPWGASRACPVLTLLKPRAS